MQISLTCQFCGQQYQRKPSKKSKHCSRKCYRQAQKAARILCVCEKCGKNFSVPPSVKAYNNSRFCSRNCFFSWQKGHERTARINIVCLQCGKPMRRLQSRINSGFDKYCSRNCGIKTRTQPRIQLMCKQCGKILYKRPREITMGRGKFCSTGCSTSYWVRHKLRNKPTDIEQLLLNELNNQNVQHEFQYPFHQWVLDFAIPKYKLAIEADGDYWHSLPGAQERDQRKDTDLQSAGWTILRFSDKQIHKSPTACIDEVIKVLNRAS